LPLVGIFIFGVFLEIHKSASSSLNLKRALKEDSPKRLAKNGPPRHPTHPHTSFSKSEGISNLNSLEKVRRGKKSEFSEESF
jgi:hypothetical protein